MEIKGTNQLSEVVKNQEYLIDYGTIEQGTETTVLIDVTDADHLSVSKSCGCTTPTVEIKPNGFQIKVSYDNNKLGTINQRVTERCVDKEGNQKTVTFNLKGNITQK
jgi:hypothetical protein